MTKKLYSIVAIAALAVAFQCEGGNQGNPVQTPDKVAGKSVMCVPTDCWIDIKNSNGDVTRVLNPDYYVWQNCSINDRWPDCA